MKRNNINNFLKIALDIADYYDTKGNDNEKFFKDELTDELGLGYKALTSYLRKGVQEVISLQTNYYKACEERNYEKSVQERQKEYLLDVFGDKEPYSINNKDKQRIKDFVKGIFEEWDKSESEDEE